MRLFMKSLVVGLGCGCLPLAEAALYEEVTTTHLPPQLAGACMNAAAGDAEGDGDLDLALAMEFQQKVLLLNDGTGRFSDASSQLPQVIHDSEDVAFADFDADGDRDLVFVSEDDRTDEFYLNDGSGRYTDASQRLVTDDVSNDLAIMDLDGDGHPDLLTGNIGTDRVLLSDGQGNFRDDTATRWLQQGESRTQELETADVDGDGDLDVIVANEGQNQLYLNEGGRLVDVTATHLPLDTDETRAIRAVDVDADTDLDLLVGNVTFITQESPQDYLLLNDGDGKFTRADQAAFPEDMRSNFMLQTLDIDRDGDMDAIAPSTVFAGNSSEFVMLARDSAGSSLALHSDGMNIEDKNADGDMDVEISDGTRRVTLINDGKGLTWPANEEPWRNTASAQDIDLNDDGGPDLGVTRVGSSLLVNENAAKFPNRRQAGMLQLVDLGRDGSTDIIVPVALTMDSVGDYQVLLNDGGGRFSVAAPGSMLPLTVDGNGFDIEVADFDSDGLNDLFLCNRASVSDPGAALMSGGLQRLLRGIED